MVEFEDFMKFDIRVGEIIKVDDFEEAHKPAYKLWIDFGKTIGTKKSSAQITNCYKKEDLLGKQILGIINFPNKQIANFISEVLVLGVYSENGVVLIEPDLDVKNGDKLG